MKRMIKRLCYYFFLGLWETIGKPLTVLFLAALFLGFIEGMWLQ